MSKNRDPVFSQLERLVGRNEEEHNDKFRYWNGRPRVNGRQPKDDPVPLDKIYKDEK